MTQKQNSATLEGWFAGRLPDDWFSGPPAVTSDREEILVVGTLAEPEYPEGADESAVAAARRARIQRFREETREQRLRMRERQTLDTLVGAGVARSRSDALAWCVRLVREHEGEWIEQLRHALVA